MITIVAFLKENYDPDDSDEFDDCETFFQIEGNPIYKIIHLINNNLC